MNEILTVVGALALLQEGDKRDWVRMIEAVVVIVAAVVSGSAVTYKVIQKIRTNARMAKATEEQELSKRIDTEVEKKRLELQSIIDMAQGVTKHWEQMATIYEKERDHEREVFSLEKSKIEMEVVRVREERALLAEELTTKNNKIEELVDLNLNMQGQVKLNAREIERLKSDLEKAMRGGDGKVHPSS